jgi:hypothetical protein
VSKVDRKKLSGWCLQMLETELREEGLQEAVFCDFCVADAKLERDTLNRLAARNAILLV